MDYRKKYYKYKAKYFVLLSNKLSGGNDPLLENPDYLLRIIEGSFNLDAVDFLEVGGGEFTQTGPLSRFFNSYTGIEKHTRSYKMAKSRLTGQRFDVELLNEDINDWVNVADDRYDVIYFRNTLHLTNYKEVFGKLIGLLKSNGMIIYEQTIAKPKRWRDKRYNKGHPDFDQDEWNKWKARLEDTLVHVESTAGDNLVLSKYMVKKGPTSNHVWVMLLI